MKEKLYTLHEKLQIIVDQHSQKILLQEKIPKGYISYSYREFLQQAKEVAQVLISLGIKKGDRIAIVLENCCEWGFVYFGIMYASAVAVPLDPQSTAEDMEYFFADSESKLVFSNDGYASILQKALKLSTLQKAIFITKGTTSRENSDILPNKVIYYLDLLTTLSTLPKIEDIRHQTTPDDLASIIYTSGTTGRPKGVMLTHKNFYANYSSIERLNFICKEDCVLSILPLHHSFPFMTTLIIPLFCGAKIIYPKTLQSEELLTCIRETGVTALIAVPQFYYLFYKNFKNAIAKIPFFLRLLFLALLQSAFYLRKSTHINLAKMLLWRLHAKFGKKLRFFISGGAKLDREISRYLFKLGFSIYEGYGLTETSPCVTINPLHKAKIGSVGRAIPDVEIKIDDPDRSGVGEILIRGPNVMSGYYRLPDKTKEVFQDDWFCSGDLGYIDAEDYLYIVGRKNELIVLASGKNIAPEEIELHYAQSPYIRELCILAIGSGAQEKLMAVIVPNLDYFRQVGEINIYGSIKWSLEGLSQELPAFKRILGFCLAKEDLPRTRLGKLRRYLIKEKYHAELTGVGEKKETPEITYSEEDLQILSSEISERVLNILRIELNLSRIPLLNEHLELDLGVDSLKRLELFIAIEKALQIKIEENILTKVFTVKELLNAILNLTPKAKIIKTKPIPQREKPSIWQEILHAEPSAVVKGNIDLFPTRLHRFITLLFDGFLYAIFRLFCQLQVLGTENIPKEQACIFCVNHNSYLDGFIITAATPHHLQKKLFFLGFIAFVRAPVIRRAEKLIRIIPISPAEHLVAAMQAGAYVLKHGKILGVFPEGARSIDGEVKEFKTGIGILIKEMNVPVVPIYIHGSFEAWPRSKTLPKPHPIKVFFGKPCYLEELKTIGFALGSKDEYSAITQGLREKVIALSHIAM